MTGKQEEEALPQCLSFRCHFHEESDREVVKQHFSTPESWNRPEDWATQRGKMVGDIIQSRIAGREKTDVRCWSCGLKWFCKCVLLHSCHALVEQETCLLHVTAGIKSGGHVRFLVSVFFTRRGRGRCLFLYLSQERFPKTFSRTDWLTIFSSPPLINNYCNFVWKSGTLCVCELEPGLKEKLKKFRFAGKSNAAIICKNHISPFIIDGWGMRGGGNESESQ